MPSARQSSPNSGANRAGSRQPRGTRSGDAAAITCQQRKIGPLAISTAKLYRPEPRTCATGGNRVNWVNDRWHDLTNVGSATWLAVAAWAAVIVGLAALFYANRHIQRNRQLRQELIRPQVSMFMEPSPTDWHVIELVVKNFGRTAAYDIGFTFFNPPTVAQYEHSDNDGRVSVVPLQLPEELPYLAPSQEWRTVWDSTLDRDQLGDAIEPRFVGTLTYYDTPLADGRESRFRRGKKPHRLQSKVILDWKTLQPAPRLELLTNHDLAKREKQKLELLRSMLNYFSYASKETRPEVLQAEIERMNRTADEAHDRLRAREIAEAPELDAPQLDETTELDLPWMEDDAASGRHHR
jgi:hypothetical protein